MGKNADEILFEELLPGFAQGIAAYFLGEPFASVAKSGIAGFFKRRRDVNYRKAHELEEHFKAIARETICSLEVLFHITDLPSNEKAATAIQLTERVKEFTIVDIVRMDLDPTLIRAELLKDREQRVRDLNPAAKSLYDKAIDRVANAIPRILDILSPYEQDVLGILVNQERQLELVVNLLTTTLAESATNNSSVEKDYLYGVARKYDKLELYGAGVSAKHKKYNLSVAYVSLNVDRKGLTSENESEALDVKQVLTVPRVLVTGEPGSGKTTLLRWLAVQCGRVEFQDPLEELNQKIPFVILLRNYAAEPLPSPNEFVKCTAPMFAGAIPETWGYEILKEGRGLVLIDGVDELPRDRREDVEAWLDELTGTFPDNRYLVTSRPVVSSDWLANLEFVRADLRPMEVPDIDSFVDHWHQAIRLSETDPAQKAELTRLGKALKLSIRKKAAVRRLARNPLLCAVICALHRERSEELPSDRIELYNAACEMLIHARDQERQLVVAREIGLNGRQKRRILGKVAYWMLKNVGASVPKETLVTVLGSILKDMNLLSTVDSATQVRDWFVERSGLLQHLDPETLSFTHKTFQEFLAAEAVILERDIGDLCNRALDDNWREVIVLAVGLAGARDVQTILSSILGKAEEDCENQNRLHLLAVACKETATEMSPDLARKLEDIIQGIVPPNTMAEAKDLAPAGQLVIPHLRPSSRGGLRKMRVPQACASIRTLALIGSDDALETLSEYAKDRRKGVNKELIRALSYFDEEEFLHRVPIAGHKIDTLNLRAPRSLSPFVRFRSLKNLNIESAASGSLDFTALDSVLPGVETISIQRGESLALDGLENARNLKSLVIRLSSVASLSPLRNLKLLESLDLTRTRIDGGHLVLPENLRTLTLSESNLQASQAYPQVHDLSLVFPFTGEIDWAIPVFPDIASLTLNSVGEDLKNPEILCRFKKLKKLELIGHHFEIDWDWLNLLINLETLALHYFFGLKPCREVARVLGEGQLTQLKRLELGHIMIEDWTFLQKLPQLKFLQINGSGSRAQLDELKAWATDSGVSLAMSWQFT